MCHFDGCLSGDLFWDVSCAVKAYCVWLITCHHKPWVLLALQSHHRCYFSIILPFFFPFSPLPGSLWFLWFFTLCFSSCPSLSVCEFFQIGDSRVLRLEVSLNYLFYFIFSNLFFSVSSGLDDFSILKEPGPEIVLIMAGLMDCLWTMYIINNSGLCFLQSGVYDAQSVMMIHHRLSAFVIP